MSRTKKKRILTKIDKAASAQTKELNLSAEAVGSLLHEIPTDVFELSQLEVLSLVGQRIEHVPPAISKLKNLRILNLAFNNLKSISERIGELRHLSMLMLWSNRRTPAVLHNSIGELTGLKSLGLVGFAFRSLPEWISRLQLLKELNLSSNHLCDLPYSIGELADLRTLWLANNDLKDLPVSISKLKHLTSLSLANNNLGKCPSIIFDIKPLVVLRLEGNSLDNLPEQINKLPALRNLDLSDNNLSSLPMTISDLTDLRTLDVSDNKLTEVPEGVYSLVSLDKLSLANSYGTRNKNKITEISPRILNLKYLQKLDLPGNQLNKPPAEIVAKGLDAIRDYFLQLESMGTDHLYEAKLLIIGEAGAGKTSLAKKLQNTAYQLKEEDSTKGIEVISWAFSMPSGQPFKVNIWDFGGQEIYHATHQFFLTKRSLYVLVADTRKEDTDFYYWLNVVELLSDRSPLLIIKNEKQDRHREININQLRGLFSNLKETLATNLATNRGLAAVEKEIKNHIIHLPQIGAALPKTWIKVRDALERESRNHVPLQEYLRICENKGFAQLKDKMQLLGYLHDLGVCLHFQGDPLLKKTVILKPKWGTDAVYKVLDNSRVIANFGRFNRKDLAKIWRESQYADMLDELLQLMINFGLCYRIPYSEFYIAPQLLTENQPQYAWDERNNLILRYTYEFMPKGIVTQFIVAVHQLIEQQEHVWKSGVILAKDEARAEITEYYGKREIRLRVAGKRRKELMTIATYELDKIHFSYSRLKYNKLIPCNCSRCKNSQQPHFYKFETLRRFADNRRNEIQCEMSFEMVDVRALIDDVIDESEYVHLEKLEPLPDRSRHQVFISYAHQDKSWLEQIETMLKPITRHGQLHIWSDARMKPGTNWRDQIEMALRTSNVAILLVSKHFLASDFIAENELPPLMTAATDRGMRILWVPISDSMYKETDIAKYQAASDPASPLDSLTPSEANRILVSICKKIKEAAND